MNHQQGFGLSEILISLFLASLIITSLCQLYLGNKRQYIEVQKILDSRFDLQWVSDLLSDSIRRSGFTPCVGIDHLEIIDTRNISKRLSALTLNKEIPQSIQINRMSERFSKIVEIQSPGTILLSAAIRADEKRALLIADCYHAEVHKIYSIERLNSGTLVTLSKPLVFTYPESAYAGEWLEETWFIHKNRRGVEALYYQGVQKEELTPLIHSLQARQSLVQDKRLIEVSLGLDQDEIQHISVMVRGS